MSTKVFGNIYSTRTQRVLLLLEELGVQDDLQVVDFGKTGNLAPEYLEQHHPFGKLPSFEDADVKIFESRAICRYLAAKYPSALSPPTTSNVSAFVAFEQAASVDYSYFEPPIEKLGFELIFKSALGLGETDKAAVAQQQALLHKTLDYYNKLLSTQDYLAGNSYSLVDVFHAPWIQFLFSVLHLSNEIESRKNLQAWWARVSSRPAWKALVSRFPQH